MESGKNRVFIPPSAEENARILAEYKAEMAAKKQQQQQQQQSSGQGSITLNIGNSGTYTVDTTGGGTSVIFRASGY